MTIFKDQCFPFEVGQAVETKSFLQGYRGAWFCGEITEISSRRNQIGHVLHYTYFPDEKKKWMPSYKVPPVECDKKRKEPTTDRKEGIERKRQLMLRPSYPPIYCDNELPPANAASEVMVITTGTWRVGDLVDWWKDGCHWSGKVTQMLGNEEAMVELFPPPMGEGESYKASLSDLRPSLNWSVQDGWTLPAPEGVENYNPCARLVYPMEQAGLPCETETLIDTQILPEVLTGAVDVQQMPSDSDSKSSKELKTCGKVFLNSTKSDTLEAALMDLEELAIKLKWLQAILKSGIPAANEVKPSWEFVEHHGSSGTK